MTKTCFFRVLLPVAAILAPLTGFTVDAEPPAPRFSVANMDPTVDPRADFGQYAAGKGDDDKDRNYPQRNTGRKKPGSGALKGWAALPRLIIHR